MSDDVTGAQTTKSQYSFDISTIPKDTYYCYEVLEGVVLPLSGVAATRPCPYYSTEGVEGRGRSEARCALLGEGLGSDDKVKLCGYGLPKYPQEE